MAAVHDFAQERSIDCDALRCDTVDVFYDIVEWEKAKESVALMKKLMNDEFISKYTFWDATQTAQIFLAPGALGSLTYEAGSLSAYRFTIGILKLALAKGLNLQCNTPVTSIKKSKGEGDRTKWSVCTERGTIQAEKVVLATNGYTAHLYPALQGVIVPFRGIVTAQRPGRSMPQKGLDMTFSFIYKYGYEYMISRPEGSKFEGDIVIGGGLTKGKSGGVEEFGNTADNVVDDDIVKYLEQSTKEFFGTNWGTDHAEGRVRKTWSGVMGYSADGHPLVGPMPSEDGLYIDASFQGHGMVLCFLCAEAVSQMIMGKDGPELEQWFPASFRVSEARLEKKFGWNMKISKATELEQETKP